MKNSKVLFITLTIILVTSLISNIAVFRSYVEQQVIVSDSQLPTPKLTLESALNKNYKYPSLDIFTRPLLTYLGRIYLREKKYDDAIKTFHRAKGFNPYLKANELYLAQTYEQLGIKDSFQYYANLAFNKMPNHPLHFSYFVKHLNAQKDTLEFDNAFKRIIYRDKYIWEIYLSAIERYEIKSKTMRENIKFIDSTYKQDDKIQQLVLVNKYGKTLFFEIVEKNKEAQRYLEKGDLDKALEIFKENHSIVKEDNIYVDKIATIYYQKKMFKKSLDYLKKIDLKKKYDIGRYLLIKGLNNLNLGNSQIGCQDLLYSIKAGNELAIDARSNFCL